MFGEISRVLVVVVALFMLVGTVSAQINLPANGYLGGDNLFCSSTRGCWLLNSNLPANGSVPVLLGEFPQADIQGALATCAAEAHNVIIGTIQGTFGPFTLSAVYDGPNADPVCSLQINAFESEGKESKPYGFAPKADGSYSPVPQPVEEKPLSPEAPNWVLSPCSPFDVGMIVVWSQFPNNGYEIDNWGPGDTVYLKRISGTDDVVNPPDPVSCNDIEPD